MANSSKNDQTKTPPADESVGTDTAASHSAEPETWHRRLEGKTGLFAVLTTIAVSIGGIVEIVPMLTVNAGDPAAAGIEPYTPLELAGRDIYVREGCYNCHSQMIRPLVAEVRRYGEWSRAVEYAYDRPFQLGSGRIGPDLAREGGLRNNAWHYQHFDDPRATTPGSIMPSYRWLLRDTYGVDDVRRSVRTMQRLGVPYTDDEVANVETLLREEAGAIVADLNEFGVTTVEWDHEVVALIAYMQRLGTAY